MTRRTTDQQQYPLAPPVGPDGIPVLGLRREAAAQALGISVRLLDERVASGAIRPTRIGAAVVFAVDELRRWLLEEGER